MEKRFSRTENYRVSCSPKCLERGFPQVIEGYMMGDAQSTASGPQLTLI
jgi:hypothetical protein